MLEILRPYISDLPKGKGKTGTYHIYLKAVIPYWLFDDYKKIGTPYKVYPTDLSRYTKDDPKKLIKEFIPAMNDADYIKW